MSLRVSCACGAEFKAKPELAGRTVKCPACEQPCTIPKPQENRPPILVKCKCGSSFKAKAELAGKQLNCPSCAQPLMVLKPRVFDATVLPDATLSGDGHAKRHAANAGSREKTRSPEIVYECRLMSGGTGRISISEDRKIHVHTQFWLMSICKVFEPDEIVRCFVKRNLLLAFGAPLLAKRDIPLLIWLSGAGRIVCLETTSGILEFVLASEAQAVTIASRVDARLRQLHAPLEVSTWFLLLDSLCCVALASGKIHKLERRAIIREFEKRRAPFTLEKIDGRILQCEQITCEVGFQDFLNETISGLVSSPEAVRRRKEFARPLKAVASPGQLLFRRRERGVVKKLLNALEASVTDAHVID